MYSCLNEFEKLFQSTCSKLADIFKEAIEKTETDLGFSMNDDDKRICIGLGLLNFMEKICNGKDN